MDKDATTQDGGRGEEKKKDNETNEETHETKEKVAAHTRTN